MLSLLIRIIILLFVVAPTIVFFYALIIYFVYPTPSAPHKQLLDMAKSFCELTDDDPNVAAPLLGKVAIVTGNRLDYLLLV